MALYYLFAFVSVIIIAEHLHDGDCFTRVSLNRGSVTCLDRAFLDHAAIQTGSFGVTESFYPLRVVHARGKRPARDARRGDLQSYITNMNVVTNIELRAFQSANRQVLAKCTGSELFTQFPRPPLIICPTVNIDRLVRSTMIFLIANHILFNAKRFDLHRFVYSNFIDPCCFYMVFPLLRSFCPMFTLIKFMLFTFIYLEQFNLCLWSKY